MRVGRIIIVAVCSFAFSFGLAQGYEQTLKKCIDHFNDGIGRLDKETAASEIERRYAVLNECIKGQKFPEFNLTTYNGSKYTSKQNTNKVVLLNFWFTKSQPSVAVIPLLNELAEEYEVKDFVILSFSSDGFTSLSEFIKKNPVKFRVFDKSKELINHQFKSLLGYPTNIILNKKGDVVEYQVGLSQKDDGLVKLKLRLKKIIDEELKK
jgi:thiol-disulfide isomerase/thioredoxin